MKLYTLTIIISLCFVNCTLESTDKVSKNTTNLITLNKDSIVRIDTVKWWYYAMNFNGTALFFDSVGKRTHSKKAVECDVELMSYRQQSADSCFYFFSFIDPGYKFLYIKDIAYTDGIGVFNKTVQPLTNHFKYDFQNNEDSTKSYMEDVSSNFNLFLKKYRGQVSPWLKEEAIRRGILH